MDHILAVDDDPQIQKLIRENLQARGYSVRIAASGEDALDIFEAQEFDLLLLDLILPGISGIDICLWVRQRSDVPIIVLSAREDEELKVKALDSGADDYVTKPFGVRELLARIHALLRRTAELPAPQPNASAPFQIGPATIDPRTFQMKRGKALEELTAKELKLLQFFAAHPGEVLSRDRLLNEVWGYNYYGTTRTLDQVIVQLRKKLGDHGSEPRHLHTIHGVGYKLMM